MNRLFRAIFFVVMSLFSTASFSQTTFPEQSGPYKDRVPDNVRSDGGFNYSIPILIPSFRGLEPDLSLSYNSSFNGKGIAEAYLGVGWQLSGIPSIERVAERGGTPTYDDANDIYRLDGADLMACADAGATNPWPATRGYPAGFKTDTASASCSAGGDLSTRVESYQKIEMKQETHNSQPIDYFLVTQKNGKQFRFTSIGKLSNSISALEGVQGRKWLLTEIRDTQTFPNSVTFTYAFSNSPIQSSSLAHRPIEINYGGGYSVKFSYDQPGMPMSDFAVGNVQLLGSQYNRLSSITVNDGVTKIRAYSMQYNFSMWSMRHWKTWIWKIRCKWPAFTRNINLPGRSLTISKTTPTGHPIL